MAAMLVPVGIKIAWITSELPQITVVMTFLEEALSFLYVHDEFFHFSATFIQVASQVTLLQIKPLTFF